MSASRAPILRMTVRRSASCSGRSLLTGQEVQVTIQPARPGTGVRFDHRPTQTAIPVDLDHVADTPRCTALTLGEARIDFAEHLLAVLAANGITDALIAVDGGEIPLIDGSAAPYHGLVLEAEPVVVDGEVLPIELDREFHYATGGKAILALPGPQQFWYLLEHDHPHIGRQCACFDPAADDFGEGIAPARTFSTEQEARALIEARKLEGAEISMSIIAFEHGLSEPEPFPNSFAKHKIIDLMGDLYLLGRPVLGRLVAHRTGHAENRVLARMIAEAYGLQ
jgi:UDP-3-O-acyl N-acetylglucosamine deacetylase